MRLSEVQPTACAMESVCHSVTTQSALVNYGLLFYATARALKVVPAVRLYDTHVDHNLSFRLPVNLRCHIHLIIICLSVI